MEFRPLGRTNLKVSSICLGTMTWGQQNTEAEGFEQMDYALEQGVNFFDTAEMYSIPPKPETQGSTERVIGAWFKARKNRDKVILASKVSGFGQMTWLRKDGSGTELTSAQMHEALDASLARLGTDYIDLYQLHFPNRMVPWGATRRASARRITRRGRAMTIFARFWKSCKGSSRPGKSGISASRTKAPGARCVSSPKARRMACRACSRSRTPII